LQEENKRKRARAKINQPMPSFGPNAKLLLRKNLMYTHLLMQMHGHLRNTKNLVVVGEKEKRVKE
jgi:hypothetical protein